MRITIATGPMFPVPPLRGGAIARAWQGLAEEFARRGHEVCIFARSFAGQMAEEEIRNVRYRRWGGFSQSLSTSFDLIRDLFYAGRAVRRLPNADILVTNDFWLPVFAQLHQRKVGRLVINANRFPKRQFWLYRRASRIAAASTAVRDAIVEQCPALADRTRVFPNPIDTDVMCPNGGRVADSSPTLLYVGRLHPEKGVHVLVKAFANMSSKHPALRLRLVGPTGASEGGGGADYERQLRFAADGRNVEFHGSEFDLAKLVELYRSADVFCYPSIAEKGEAFGVAPLEAMACGLPPVVSDLDCFRDFIVPGNNGWVFNHRTADRVGALTTALDAAVQNADHRAEIAKRARETAECYTYSVIAEQYLSDFTALLNGESA
jgi:glycosyltransferase involved in cell wall biosynthesis